jgi:hypothetical protein
MLIVRISKNSLIEKEKRTEFIKTLLSMIELMENRRICLRYKSNKAAEFGMARNLVMLSWVT